MTVRIRIEGRTVTRTFPTRKKADAYVAETEAAKVRGTAIDPRRGEQLFGDYARSWLDTRRTRGRMLAPKTRELYEILLRVHIEPTFGAHPLGAITPEAVRRWYAKFTSPLTAAKSYRLPRAIMLTALSEGLIHTSPCRIKNGGVERSANEPSSGQTWCSSSRRRSRPSFVASSFSPGSAAYASARRSAFDAGISTCRLAW